MFIPASLNDRQPVDPNDDVVVLLVPDYQLLSVVERIAGTLKDEDGLVGGHWAGSALQAVGQPLGASEALALQGRSVHCSIDGNQVYSADAVIIDT